MSCSKYSTERRSPLFAAVRSLVQPNERIAGCVSGKSATVKKHRRQIHIKFGGSNSITIPSMYKLLQQIRETSFVLQICYMIDE